MGSARCPWSVQSQSHGKCAEPMECAEPKPWGVCGAHGVCRAEAMEVCAAHGECRAEAIECRAPWSVQSWSDVSVQSQRPN